MGAKSRTKGIVYEREVCGEVFEALSLRVSRSLGQERDSGSDIELPMVREGSVRLECKRRAKIGNVRDWYRQVRANCKPADLPAVVMRADGWATSLVVIDFADFLYLLREELAFETGGNDGSEGKGNGGGDRAGA